jgi:hypothetical protein
MSEPAPNPSDSRHDEVDVYCLKCGYNLRGLPGDSRRCPECFAINLVGEFGAPPELVLKQLRRMETAPTLCVTAAAAMLFLAYVTYGKLPDVFRPNHYWDTTIRNATFFFVSVLVWSIAAWRFSNSCKLDPRWFTALMRFHARGLSLVALVAALVIGMSHLLGIVIPFRKSPSLDRPYFLACLAGGVILVAAILRLFRPLHAWATNEMKDLQRGRAVDIVRQRLHRQAAIGESQQPLHH